MLTARAEYRLRLRADNAEARLTPKAIEIGCVGAARRDRFCHGRQQRAQVEELLAATAGGARLREAGISVRDDGVKRSLGEWLRFPQLDAQGLVRLVPELRGFAAGAVAEAVEDHRYAPYVERQHAEINRLRADEAVRIPESLDYAAVGGLSNEMVERLSAARPATLGAAGRIRGITPAALAAILIHARRKAA
jgi:tRNA uridine 5-carboxymethylaminomethyl modification enzyme